MRNFSLGMLLILVFFSFLSGCTANKIHFHPWTDEILDRDARDLKVQQRTFRKYKKFVRNGVLFVPQVREIGWKDYNRSFVRFYSQVPKVVYVAEAIGRDRNGNETTLVVNQAFILEKHKYTTGLYKSYVPLIFKSSPKAAEVLTGGKINLELKYWLAPEPLQEEPRSIQFKLKQRTEFGSVFDSV